MNSGKQIMIPFCLCRGGYAVNRKQHLHTHTAYTGLCVYAADATIPPV